MKKNGIKAMTFAAVLIIALAAIVTGTYNAWRAFREFDETILKEKDSQFYSIIRSNDVNIENSVDTFTREAETLFTKDSMNRAVAEWRQSGELSQLQSYLDNNSLKSNPMYGGMLMMRKNKIVITETVGKKIKFLTEADGSGIRICKEGDNYYLAYEHIKNNNIKYDALIDLAEFYRSALGEDPDAGLIMIDSTSTVLLRKPGKKVIVTAVDKDMGEDTNKCRDFIVKCQKDQTSGGKSLQLTNKDGTQYTARMVVISSGETENDVFAVGIVADYDTAIAPSRAAAKKILLYGGIAAVGVLMLIVLLILTHRRNAANRQELETLKKKNDTLAEINQQMQALSHHQRLETIGTMTAGIAHDFNNLLTPIMGYSIMTMEMLPADATDIQENLMEVYNASVKAKDIVSRLSDLSKKSRVEDYTELNPDEVVKSSLKVTLPAKPENVEVKIRFKSGRCRILGDRTQISQLVMNIVLNAYDAMREKGGTLLISTRPEGRYIVLKFKDTGDGMSPETVSRIFDPFFTTKESGKGTGLGLALVAQIVESHEGRIYVDSEPGEGTEFRILLPIYQSTNTIDMKKTIVAGTGDFE